MVCANSFTRGDVDLDTASLPASISTWFAVTTIAAIWASLGKSAAPAAANASTPASTDNDIFIGHLLSGVERQAQPSRTTMDVTTARGVPDPASAWPAFCWGCLGRPVQSA